MEFTVKNVPVEKQRSACVVVGVFESRRLSASAAALDRVSRGYIVNILKRGDMKGTAGQVLWLHDVPRTACDRILLVGFGKEKELGDVAWRQGVGAMATALRDAGLREAFCALPELEVRDRGFDWKVRRIVEITADACYRFDRTKSEVSDDRPRLARLHINIPEGADVAESREAVRRGKAVVTGMTLAKDLGNLPPNICTPGYLADEARRIAGDDRRFSLKVFERKDMERLGMGALLAVARGSREPPRFIVLEYRGGKRGDKPWVLVGKGITFDSGGISIKPAQAMDEMKYDMCGAASVLGTAVAAAELELPLNVTAVIPTCENLPGGEATRPGDIVTTLAGLTVEVLNTDAEGRLILADALAYCERLEPRGVIDVATLTGACVIALGKHASGLLGADPELVSDLRAAGEASGDRAWELPLWDEYQEQLKSNFADIANVGGREGGTITAASFLSRFARNYPWAHLDIAGVAWRSGNDKGATGRPVPLLIEFLLGKTPAAS